MHRMEVRIGTAGGTLLSTIAQLNAGDLFKTVVLAAVGAVVSYGVTLLLKKMR